MKLQGKYNFEMPQFLYKAVLWKT